MGRRTDGLTSLIQAGPQGIRIIQSNRSFLLFKYTYMQGYMFRLREAIIRPLPYNRSKFDFVQLGSLEFTVLKCIAYGVQLS
jgi:hypothetical protein